MTIAVFGGTGRTGRLFIKAALEKGHKIRCLARDPDKIAPAFGLEFIKGDALDGGKVMLTLTGSDAAAVFLGAVPKGPKDLCSRATELILMAMARLQIRPLLAVTSLGVGETWAQIPGPLKILFSLLLKDALKDKERQEALITASPTDWVIVRPGGLVDKATGRPPKIGTDRDTPAGQVSRADVAAFCAEALGNPRWSHQAPYIT